MKSMGSLVFFSGFAYETALIRKENLESCLVFTFQFFHLDLPLLVRLLFYFYFFFFIPLHTQFNTLYMRYDMALHILRLLCNFFFSFATIFRSYFCALLARTIDKKEVGISICSEYVINIFPWIKFMLLLLFFFSLFFCSCSKVVLLVENLKMCMDVFLLLCSFCRNQFIDSGTFLGILWVA